jgi:diacylglycerol kinase
MRGDRSRWSPTYGAVVADLRQPITGLGRSFGYALRGMWLARSGRNIRIHVLAAVAVGLVAAVRGVTGTRLGLLALTVGVVLAAELFNTALERACDLVAEVYGLGRDERIRDIKDLAAGAVLTVALAAVTVAAALLTEP